MRKYLSLAVVALSSGGALFAAAGAASAATSTDSLRAAPWQATSPLAMHAAPFGDHDVMGLCGMQRDNVRTGQIDTDLVQKLCAGEGDMQMPPVLGPPPVMTPPVMTPPVMTPPVMTPPVMTPPVRTPPPMGSPAKCSKSCTPVQHHHPKPPKHQMPPTPPVMPPPPVTHPMPCPPPVMPPPPVTPPMPCPPPVMPPPPVPCPPPTPNPCPPGHEHGWSAEPDAATQAAPAAGNAVAGLPILGSVAGGLL
jgi:hypothetical protein